MERHLRMYFGTKRRQRRILRRYRRTTSPYRCEATLLDLNQRRAIAVSFNWHSDICALNFEGDLE